MHIQYEAIERGNSLTFYTIASGPLQFTRWRDEGVFKDAMLTGYSAMNAREILAFMLHAQ